MGTDGGRGQTKIREKKGADRLRGDQSTINNIGNLGDAKGINLVR